MLGTIVNAGAIAAGGFVGLFVKGSLPERYKTIVSQAIGLSVLFIGLAGSISKLIMPESNPILFIISLVVGAIVGEWAGIEQKLEGLGNFLQSRLKGGDGSFSKGFVTASLLFCVGTMSVLGSIESGVSQNHSILFAKAILDGVTSVIFASTFGIGVVFSAGSVFIYQGAITLLSRVIAPYLTTEILNEMSAVGGILIAGLGFDLLGMVKIRVGNMLPAIIVPIIYLLLRKLFMS